MSADTRYAVWFGQPVYGAVVNARAVRACHTVAGAMGVTGARSGGTWLVELEPVPSFDPLSFRIASARPITPRRRR